MTGAGPGVDHLLVDGYNVIHLWDELRAATDLEGSRERLLDELSSFQGFTGAQVTVVFDSASPRFSPPRVDRGVHVIYAHRPTTADHVIEAMCRALSRQGAQVGVVTSDRTEGDLAFGMGCRHWTVPEFALEVARAKAEMARWASKARPGGRPAALRRWLERSIGPGSSDD